ncbi:MAG TPA: hypothetical protein VF173_18185 [Thermoanaerobaculia bacterium]|nr:hypothetical protein [Thermoanaerobaculia bacterium]
MPRFRLTAPLFAVLLFAGLAAPAMAGADRWTRIGPDAAAIQCVAAAPSRPEIAYAGLGMGGVFRSADGGKSWTWASRGLEWREPIYAFAISPSDPGMVYALTSRGLYKTKNGGDLMDAPRAWRLAIRSRSRGPSPKRPHRLCAPPGGTDPAQLGRRSHLDGPLPEFAA